MNNPANANGQRGRGRGRGAGAPQGRGNFNTPGLTCHYCGKLNHIASQCFQKQRDFDAFVAEQMQRPQRAQAQGQPMPTPQQGPRLPPPCAPGRGGGAPRFAFPRGARGGRGRPAFAGRVFEAEQTFEDSAYTSTEYAPTDYAPSDYLPPYDQDQQQADLQVPSHSLSSPSGN